MPRTYAELAEVSSQSGIVDRSVITETQVQQSLTDWLEEGEAGAPEELIEEVSDVLMEERIQADPTSSKFPATVGKRKNIILYIDRWGNIMGHNKNTGTRGKIVDSEERIR